MTRRPAFLLFVWVGMAVGQNVAPAQNVAIVPRVPPHSQSVLPQPLLRVDSALVLIPAHVSHAWGDPVTGLTAGSFHVFEDDVEQTVASFSSEDAPVSIGLLFDASGSMRNKMDKACEAAAAFFRTANADDEFFLVEFAGRVKISVPLTYNANELYERITHIKPSGQTPLFDAIHTALKQMKGAHNSRKALVILSDGGDNWSTHTFHQIREALIESDAQVYAMGIFDDAEANPHRAPEEVRGPSILEDLTSQTGGRLFTVDDLEDLPRIATRISRELRAQYVLGYYPKNTAHDGKYRRVKVTVTGELPGVRVYYRTGYYAPKE
ncbi:MAG TPA: VWA domain-containing protein [Bryobacteraceae bacterium]|nr:VWA domain-containing protein [Bryobacteraceae bacterium]